MQDRDGVIEHQKGMFVVLVVVRMDLRLTYARGRAASLA
jgi:hypothetical protein